MANAVDFGGRREFLDGLMKIADRSTAFGSRFMELSNPVTNPKLEWVNKTLVAMKDLVAATISSTTATIITLSGGTNSPKRIIDTVTVLLIGSERMTVTSTITVLTNQRQVVVSRGADSTTPSTYNPATEVQILNNRSEGFTAGRDDVQAGVREYNLTSIIERQAILSGTALSTNAAGNETEMRVQIEDLIGEIYKQLEFQLIYGIRKGDGTTSREAGGLLWFAQQAGNTFTATTLNETVFEGAIETYVSNGGDAKQLCCAVSTRQQRQINKLKQTRINSGGMRQNEYNIDNFVNTFNFGTQANVEIFYSPDIRANEAFFFQKDKVKIRPMKDRAMAIEDLGRDGDRSRKLLVAEYTFQIANARETLLYYNGLATT